MKEKCLRVKKWDKKIKIDANGKNAAWGNGILINRE